MTKIAEPTLEQVQVCVDICTEVLSLSMIYAGGYTKIDKTKAEFMRGVHAECTRLFKQVWGNRAVTVMQGWDDLRLIFAAHLRRALELIGEKP